MKKWGYLLSGVVIGAMLMTSGSALAAQVKSLVGQKVTGEYTVIVNGKALSDKGAVIDGKTNAPVRAISDAIGSKLDVDNKKKVINIITETNEDQTSNTGAETANKYVGQSKESLTKIKNGLENDTLKVLRSEREKIKASLDELESFDNAGEITQQGIESTRKQLSIYDADIAKYTEELRLVNEALEALK
ncbi:copper amine oxidase [Paenibacillus sp. 79R4]|nr:copper amine oxidase [Paenibacillus sp. 79R4]